MPARGRGLPVRPLAVVAKIGRVQVLETMRPGVPVRIIHRGMDVTMNHSETCLNIAVGEDGRIARV